MLLCHRMMNSNIVFVLHILNGQIVCFVYILGLQCGQGDTAAADHGISETMNHIAADRTDIEFTPEHIGGNIPVGDVFPVHQFDQGDAQSLCQRLQQRNIRQPLGGFPFGNGLAADADPFRQFCLGHIPLFSQIFDGSTGYGYDDVGRDVIEKVYASVFRCEDALVRSQFISGSHALTVALFAFLRPGDLMLSITGTPYDTFVNRIMFPLYDLDGKVVGFSGRIYKDNGQNKYLNTKETDIFKKGELLYHYHIAREECRKSHSVIVMEGFMDVIRLYSIGIYNVVASMGTAITKEQKKRKITIRVRI